MSAPISSIVTVSIASGTANPTRQGFGTALILSHTATWAERTREYSDAAEVLVDFAATTPEYKAAAKLFAQDPSPDKVKVGRANDSVPTQRWAITPVAVHSKRYAGNVNGLAWFYDADSATTVAEIIAGIKIAIDALAQAVTTSDQTTYLRMLANVAGVWHSFGTTLDGSARNDPNLGVAQDHADPTIATALAAILAADSDWYALITTFNSKALVDAAASWCETNGRLYVVQTQDSACINTALSGTDDVMESLKGNAYAHAAAIYSEDTADFADAAWVGNRIVDLPGSNTWKFATLASVLIGNYSSTQRSNVRAKKGNFYEDIAGVGITQDGFVSSGSYIDFTIYKDYLTARLGEGIFAALAQSRKTPYDDGGIAIIGNVITAQLQSDADRGAILKGTWFVTLPKSADIPAGGADRLARILNGVKFYAEYADPIQSVAVAGVLVP